MAKEIFVHVDLKGKTHFVGRLWIHTGKQGESASFEYSREWRKSSDSFALEPTLKLGEGLFTRPKEIPFRLHRRLGTGPVGPSLDETP